MHVIRPAFAVDPRQFGRAIPRCDATAGHASPGGDLKLFVTTFAAGFLFVSVLIA